MKSLLSIIVFLAAVFGLVRLRSNGSTDHKTGSLQAITGDVLCRPDGRAWNVRGTDVLAIVTSPTCSACRLSKTFEDELYDYGVSHSLPITYILPIHPDSDLAAVELQAAGRSVVRVNLAEFGMSRLPTFMRLTSRGQILSKWTGTVPPDRHDEVFRSITSGASLEDYRIITVSQSEPYFATPGIQVLALSKIGGRRQVPTIWIPLAELGTRANYELDPSRLTLVDCGTTLLASQCQDAAMYLAKQRFNVIAIGLPRRPSCRVGWF